MKTVKVMVIASLLLVGMAFSATPVAAQAIQFTGVWINEDSGTGGVTRLDIALKGNNVSVHAWGKCTPTDCDWGRVNGTIYAPSVSSNLVQRANALTAMFTTNFSQTLLVMHIVGNQQLRVEALTRFTDNSGRSHYHSFYTFAHPRVPSLLSPQCGTVFSIFPRTTTLKWSAVPGAVSYTAEVDCYHCCKTGKWCTDVGQTYRVAPNLTQPRYTFNFVGAQPGRWRVWATFSGGVQSEKTPWCGFTYTK